MVCYPASNLCLRVYLISISPRTCKQVPPVIYRMTLDIGPLLWYMPLKCFGAVQIMVSALSFLVWQPIAGVVDVLFYGLVRLPMSILFVKLLLFEDEKLQVHAGRVWEFAKILYQFLSAACLVGACVGVWLGACLILVSYLLLWEKPTFTPFHFSSIPKWIAEVSGLSDMWSKIVRVFEEPKAEDPDKTKRYVLSLTSEQLKNLLVGEGKRATPALSEGATLVERNQSSKRKSAPSVSSSSNKFSSSPRRHFPVSPKSSVETVNQNFQRPASSGTTTRTATSFADSTTSTLTETSPLENLPVTQPIPPELAVNPMAIPTQPFWRSTSSSDMQQLTESPRSSRSSRSSINSLVDPQYDDDSYFTPISSQQIPRSPFTSSNNAESSRRISDYVIPEEEEVSSC